MATTSKKKTTKKTTAKKKVTKKAPSKAKTEKTEKSKKSKFKTKSELTKKWLEKVNASRAYAGKSQIRTADQVKTPYALRRSTGIIGLDLEIGGGFPAGGCIEIHGPESSGKTFLFYHTCGALQRIYGEETRIAIFKTENRQEKDFARLSGFCIAYAEEEIDEMNEIRKSFGEPGFTEEEVEDLRTQIGDTVIITAANADTGLQIVKDGLQENIFQLIGIDSLGALLTSDVEKGSVSDSHYAGPSRIMTQFQNQIYPLLTMDLPDGSMRETTLIGINQMRANVGGNSRFAKDKPGMGAWAWKHGQLVNLKLEKMGKIWEGEKHKSPVVGHIVRWETVKGKAGTHDGKKGEYEYYHFPRMTPVFWKDLQETCYGGPGIYEDLFATAKKFEVIEVSGSWYAWTSSDGKLTHRCQGGDVMARWIAENPDAEREIRNQLIRAANLLVRYK